MEKARLGSEFYTWEYRGHAVYDKRLKEGRSMKRFNGSSRNHGAFVKIEDFKMLKFRRIV